MISLFNMIVRRGHTPREPAIRRLMESVGLVIEPNIADGGDIGSDSDQCGSLHEEGAESSNETDDDEVVADPDSNVSSSHY